MWDQSRKVGERRSGSNRVSKRRDMGRGQKGRKGPREGHGFTRGRGSYRTSGYKGDLMSDQEKKRNFGVWGK